MRLNAGYLAKDIRARFDGLIDISDAQEASEEQRDRVFLTRGLAAFTLADSVPEITDEIAAKHVTDGSEDCGIDALYFDESTKRVIVIQSKWHENGTGSIGLGDVRNSIAGLEFLMNEQFDRFNAKFTNILPSIENALGDINAKFELIVVVTGQSELSKEPQRAIDDFLAEMNDISEFAKFRMLGIKELRNALIRGGGPKSIDVDVSLINWGPVSEPYAAYFGLVAGRTLVDWYHEYGGALFDKNLRKALGATSVNSAIIETVANSPEHFWYFNNGVTVLCDKLNKPPKGGSSRLSGQFHAEGISIVNGAQTVSSLAAVSRDAPQRLEEVLVWIRLISLEGAPDTFANDVTKSTNTQNSVEASDFFALDPNQSRLREDFRLALAKEYVFRRGDVPPDREKGTTAADALIALACAMSDSGFAVIAKSAIGRLEERGGRYYSQLITNGRSSYEVWNCVKVLRTVEERLSDLRSSSHGKDRAIATQGNRIVAHIVMQEMGGISDIGRAKDDVEIEELVRQARDLTPTCFDSLTRGVAEKFSGNYITSLFKNASRCAELVDWVKADLRASSSA